MRARYSRWDDTQDPFGPELSAGELLEELSDDMLSGLGAEGALSRLLRRGMQGSFNGLDALRARLRERRAREQANLDLAGPLEELRERLDDLIDRERSTLSFRAEDDARMREAFLDALPPDVPGRIGELTDYRFVDPEAQSAFDELMEHLREQVMGAYFRSMAEGLRSMSAEDLARFRDMLAELNEMIERRERGEPYDFEGFMQRYGDLFPGDPTTLDELLEQMAARMAAMSAPARLDVSAGARRTPGARPAGAAGHGSRVRGRSPGREPRVGSPRDALGRADARGRRRAAAAVGDDRRDGTPARSRGARSLAAGRLPGCVHRRRGRGVAAAALGEDAVRDLRRLKEIERALERAGLVSRERGRLEVTPKGARKMGERALVRVFEHLRRDREGVHEAREAGGLAEPTGATRPWRFGDAGQIAVQRSVFNAVVRGGPGARVRLEPDDLELLEAEQRTEAATALLLDLSFSMPLRGH